MKKSIIDDLRSQVNSRGFDLGISTYDIVDGVATLYNGEGRMVAVMSAELLRQLQEGQGVPALWKDSREKSDT